MTPSFPAPPAPLEAGRLERDLLAPAGPWARIMVVERTGSTNADAVTAALADPAGWPDLSALLTTHQDAGRGRLDRSWVIEPGTGLAISLVLRPVDPAGRPLPTQTYGWLTLLAALALAESLGGPDGVTATIKWPNDVLVHERKIAGILAQLASTGDGTPPAVVLGCGINVSQEADALPVPTATSLAAAGSRRLDPTDVAAGFLSAFAGHYREFCARHGDATMAGDGTSLIRGISLWMGTLGRRVRVQLPDGTDVVGEATGLAADGALQVIGSDLQQHEIHAGDIVHLRTEDDQ
ncbi:biotin--[acetyl-CoA-carboxylase] ligase [Tersicoccus solisilvae]|uniref:biotin--[biotin carboxyl-carrier protein] ligase n=1 Tax=Tersicoccus solisilvae TaxID=1882339 RepID=A0ABQ1PMP3_9MICC|nr:biotin--[acetyl-CoA-carboxylase] ligase [Tersicoccus solisilvae]GGC99754.1 biotin--[acetyl-CoA-carboxylase] ligase [Tersicoccus solisilvae]